MVPILCDIALGDAGVRALKALPGMTLHVLPRHDEPWHLPADIPRDIEILLCKWPPRELDSLSGLKLIQLSSVGYENLRRLGMADRPLRVCNARGLYDAGIAEWVIAMIINLGRDLRGMLRNQDAGRWDRADRFQYEVRGKTVGLWGYGGIGRECARLARALGLRVHVLTRTGVRPRVNAFALPGTGDPAGVLPDRVFLAGQERAFLGDLDFLVLALPHTRESDGMIGEAEFQALPRWAFVLNPARGPIIQEPALLRALSEGWIAGAALDTHFAYPLPPEHPLWRMTNVILTPHIAGSDKGAAFPARLADLFVDNVSRYLEGRPLLNEITRQQWHEAERD